MAEFAEKLLITAGVIIIRKGCILLVKRDNTKKVYPGAWTFPGGKMEEGESLEDCARRECLEEAGVTPINLRAHSFHEFVAGNTRTITHLYRGEVIEAICKNDDVQWFSLDQLTHAEIAFDYAPVMQAELMSAKS